jgi:hypothetical protein
MRRQDMLCNRPSEITYRFLAEPASLRRKIEGIKIEVALLPPQEKADTVGVYCTSNSHHHCPDQTPEILVRYAFTR